jgi:hypothetical protein
MIETGRIRFLSLQAPLSLTAEESPLAIMRSQPKDRLVREHGEPTRILSARLQ